MRVLICGGRDIRDAEGVYKVLDRLAKGWPPDVAVIEGDARGVDRMAGYWARRNRLTDIKYPADWKAHGKGAGPIRNQKMLEEGRPDIVVAFPGGHGTADMVARARKAGLRVIEATL